MIKRYKKFPSPSSFSYELEDVSKPEQVFTESVADESQFIPTSDLVKAIRGSLDLGSAAKAYYDYPNGLKSVADGDFDVPFARNKSLDRAELSTFIQATEPQIKDIVKNASAQKQDKVSDSPAPAGTVLAPDSGGSGATVQQ